MKCFEFDHNIYVLHVHGDALIVTMYIDDLVITSNNLDLILRLKRRLDNSFERIDLFIFHFFLGFQVLRLLGGLFLSHSKYAFYLLKHFKMDDYKPRATHFQLGVKLKKECESPKVNSTFY